MKKNNLIWTMMAGLALTVAACSNYDADEHHYDNKAYLSASVLTQDVLFKAGSPDVNTNTELTVSIAKPEAHEISLTMKAAPELLDTYKAAYYNDEVVVLPEENYVIEEGTVTINPGTIVSSGFPISFVNLGALDMDLTYVLPVTIASAEGIGILQSGKTYYYVFKAASLVNVVCGIQKNRAYPDFNNDAKFNNLRTNTMEMLFKANSFSNSISTLMGIEGHYLLRLGDSEPKNQLQIACQNNMSSSDLQFEPGVWYHLAVVFDNGSVTAYVNGQKKLENARAGRSSISLGAKHHNEEDGSRVFWIGYSYASDRYFDGVISEARIWDRALTEEEIQAPNHFYEVDPASEGLIAYWKMNEGVGQTAKDYAGEYDLTFDNEPSWEPAALPEKNNDWKRSLKSII